MFFLFKRMVKQKAAELWATWEAAVARKRQRVAAQLHTALYLQVVFVWYNYPVKSIWENV